jgi:hypothetical protein
MRFKEVFLDAPEDIMTPEFRQYITDTWNDTEQLPTVEEMADTVVWLMTQEQAHITEDVQVVLIGVTEAALQFENQSDDDFTLAIEQRLATKQ